MNIYIHFILCDDRNLQFLETLEDRTLAGVCIMLLILVAVVFKVVFMIVVPSIAVDGVPKVGCSNPASCKQ
jgi:hypothetical protein